MKTARITFHQHTPERPPVMFEVIEPQPGKSWWHAKISDAIQDDRPEFVAAMPAKSKSRMPTAQEVANVAKRQLNEGCGHILLTYYQDGVPVFSGLWWAPNRLHDPICIRSTDADRAKVIDPATIPGTAAAALAKVRDARIQAVWDDVIGTKEAA